MGEPLKRLTLLDPRLAEEVRSLIAGSPVPVSADDLAALESEALRWVSVEISFGYAVARGYGRLLAAADGGGHLRRYREMVAAAGEEGPHLGRLMAEHLPPVLMTGSDLLRHRFQDTIAVMRRKGAYTLKGPLEGVARLLESGDQDSASAFLELLHVVFSHKMGYHQSLHLSHALPRSIFRWSPGKRPWRIRALTRMVAADIGLADPFLEGMEKGVRRLGREGLNRFVREGLAHHRADPRLGRRFVSLASRLGLEALDRLRVSVTLEEVGPELNRYLRARTGLSMSVRPLSDLSGAFRPTDGGEATAGVVVLSDGRHLYLPKEIDRFGSREENRSLYKCLAKLESALYEFGTFRFDPEKAADRYGLPLPAGSTASPLSDLDRFAAAFPLPELARDLFTLFEHGRLRRALGRSYPGILRRTDPPLRDEAGRIWAGGLTHHPMVRLYSALVLGIPEASGACPLLERIIAGFFKEVTPETPVERCAGLVQETYGDMAALVTRHDGLSEDKGYRPLPLPFGRRLGFELLAAAWGDEEAAARTLKERLEKHGVKVYKSDIRTHLMQNAGTLDPETIESLMVPEEAQHGEEPGGHRDVDIGTLSALLGDWRAPVLPEEESPDARAFRYREWDYRLGDYLPDHVRVREHRLDHGDTGFYETVLRCHPGSVRRIRHAFELLRPQGLTLLRQWVEGDDFDYRALLDFAVDRKAGRTPTDRLYIKRVKGQRDVAVLLLVDLSRSTANPAAGGEERVLDVEKAAIVLFCEALRVVGDTFAVAGFSGTGRLGVDYYRIKDFEEDVTEVVKRRIAALVPRRSTRMGAAIRHGADRLAAVPAASRILMVLGDGYPNDTDYKREYAIEDTRKAILEAGGRRIHTRAITVNMDRTADLDDLYGPLHHNVISDVRDLPDKLLRIYSALTGT